MSIRGISDPMPEPEDVQDAASSSELEETLKELILSHNMLHDRLVRLEAIIDKLTPHAPIQIPAANQSKIEKPRWRKG
jgi:uncharacterized protein YidB (DUF937 family)